MNPKYIGILVIPLLLAGCGRQRPNVAAAADSGPAASATAPAPTAPAALPENPQGQSPIQSAVPAQAPPAISASADRVQVSQPLTIPAHTRIRVRLAEALDTRRVRPGQRFTAYLDDPIVIGDHMVVPKGTAFEGRITESRNSGRLKGRAYLGLTLDGFQYGGISYSIGTGIDVRASGSHKTRNLALIGGGTGTGAAIGAIAGGGVGAAIGAGAGAAAGTTAAIVSGKKIVRLPAETVLYFSLRSAVTVGT
jgi:hypothetical protein